MRLQPLSHVDLPTLKGPMRTFLFRPDSPGQFPGVVLFAEIYQMTEPVRRMAAFLAGQGFLVAVPDVYHEFTELGEAFEYDKPGTERGNDLKTTKELASYDSDARAAIEYLQSDPGCTGRIGVMGICLGGHLAFRAAMNEEVATGVCAYATDIHTGSLGKGKSDDSLARIPEIRGEMMMIWGRQDPHVPREGRRLIYDTMTDADTLFSWHEFNAEHAFLRDLGPRYDPALAQNIYAMIFQQFTSRLK